MQVRWTWLAPLLVVCGAMAADPSTAGKPQARLVLGEAAPEISATSIDGKGTSLAAIRCANEGRVIVLQFGSITDPIFRSHVLAVERLARLYEDKVQFVVVYQREAHAADGADPLELNQTEGFNIAEPSGISERQALAKQATERLHLEKQQIVVDAWNNASSLRYGSYPNMTFVIDVKGNLQAGYPFMDPPKVQSAVESLLAGKDMPASAKGAPLRAATGPAPFDYAGAAADMTGGRGPAGIAAVLDRINLNESQRMALLPAIAEYMADVQTFRQARGGPGRGGAQGQQGNGQGDRGSPPPDFQTAMAALHSSADRLKTVIKQNLNTKDAAALYSALDVMAPAQRLFSNPG